MLLWLTRSWISARLENAIRYEYDQKLETHKATLKAQTDVELEKLRSDLAIIANERSIKLTKLHEIRAEVIADTYSLLRELHNSIAEYVKAFIPAGDRSQEDRRNEVVKAHATFFKYYSRKRIFLPRDTVEKIDTVELNSRHTYYDFFYGVEMVG